MFALDRFTLSVLAMITATAVAVAQSTPMIVPIGSPSNINPGAYTPGTITGLSAAGANPGYTQFQYGTTGSSAAAFLLLNGTNPANGGTATTIKYFTNSQANPSQSPNTFLPGFNPYTDSFTITVVAPQSSPAPASSTIFVRTNDSGVATYSVAGAGLATNARLNEILKFDDSGFLVNDGAGNAVPISSLPGYNASTQFSFSFSSGFTGIDLNFTPIPEPGLMLGLAAAGLAVARRVRRRV